MQQSEYYLFSYMKIFFSIFLLTPTIVYCQLSDSMRNKVRQSTTEYSIQYDTVPIIGSNTLPCLSVKINGKGPYKFLIDLGSNVVNFKQSIVEETRMEVVVDRSTTDIVKAERLEIGKSIFYNVHGGAYQNLDVDGVIGFNLLRNANFFMDYPHMKFAFIQQETEQKDNAYIRYEIVSRMPYLKSTVENKKVLINFDTGASLWLYFPLRMKDSVQLLTSLEAFREMTNNQTGTTMTYIGKLKGDVVFGNYTIKSPYVIFDPDIDDIFVGSSLLNQFKLSFYTRQELIKMERAEKGNLIVIPKDQGKSN